MSLLETETFDIMLMDGRRPRMNGIETTRKIRECDQRSGRHTVIVAVTAHALDGDREAFLASGMDGYVTKPIHKAKLFEAIDTALCASFACVPCSE